MSEEQSNSAPAQQEAAVSEESVQSEQQSSQAQQDSGAQQAQNLNSQQQEAVSQAIAEGASPAEVKQLIKEYKLKVNGKEVVKKYKSDEELIRDLQLAEANKGGMQKSRELEKLFEREAKRLKEDPWSVLQELGHDPVKLAEMKLEQWVQEQQKSPEQREYEQMQRELAAAREELKSQKEAAEEAKRQSLKQSAFKEIEKEIADALSSYTTLPNTRKTVTKIADALIWAMDNGFPQASVADVIPVVEAEIKAEFNEFLENAPDEVFEGYVGKKKLENYRKKRVSSIKASNVPSNDVPQVSKAAEPKAKEKIPMKDFFKNPEKYMKR